jgi:hypothetical protein
MLKIISLIILFSMTLNSNATENPKKEAWRYPVKEIIHISLPEQRNKNIYFTEIPLSQLKVIRGNEKINVEYWNFKGGPKVSKFSLKGEYLIKYGNIEMNILKDKIFINNKEYPEHSIAIDKSGKIQPNKTYMYWECHIEDTACQEVNSIK